MSQITVVEKKRRRGLWPVMGLFMAVALGIIAYFLAPSVIELTKQLLPQFSTGGIPREHLRLIFTFLTFVIMLSFVAFLVAIFMPKKPINVNENDLKKERAQMQAYKKYERQRQRKINRETQAYLREKSKRGD
ncbi:MAG: hypothetical protein L0Z53_19145 [Acidobacteriales bacterium]|nr:hypothetical protein [Terriglobales bacterium]